MPITLFDVTQRRLNNQHLLRPSLLTPQAVVSWLVAVQSQDYTGAKWSVGQRMTTATDAVLDEAFNTGAILRTHVLRPTWHFVAPADIRWLLMLTAPRVHAVNGTMYRQTGLDEAMLGQSAAIITQALQGGNALTRDALRDHLRQAGLDTSNLLRVTYIVMWAELEQIICSGPRQGKQFTYMLMDERVPAAAPLTYDEALTELSRRYFRSRGPATPADFAKWSGLTLSEARNGLEAVKNEFAQVEAGGQVYYLPSTSLPPTAAAPRAFLLSIYDEMISSYKDRSAIGEAEVGLKLLSMGNALTHIVLLEGQIVGTFRRELKTKQPVLELNLFRAVTLREDEAIAAAADQYSTFLQLPVHLIRTQP